jgi:hypothetical protein
VVAGVPFSVTVHISSVRMHAVLLVPCCSLSFSSFQAYWDANCVVDEAASTPWKNGVCRTASLNYPLQVDIRDFEIALVNALVHVGVNVTLDNRWPVRDESTSTGWSSGWSQHVFASGLLRFWSPTLR